jgi:hypothetical protein
LSNPFHPDRPSTAQRDTVRPEVWQTYRTLLRSSMSHVLSRHSARIT